MEKEHKTGVLESLFDRTTDYIETRVELTKLKAIRKTSQIVSSIVSSLIIAVAFCFFLLLLNIALGFWLGEFLGKTYYGFFAMAGFYLIVGLIVFASRSRFKTSVINSLIKKMHSDNEN